MLAGEVVQYQHLALYLAIVRMDGRVGQVDRDFLPVMLDQQQIMVILADGRQLYAGLQGRQPHFVAALQGIDQPEQAGQRLAARQRQRTRQQLLGGRVHVVDLSLGIGGDHRFANGRQRDFGAFFLALQRVFDFFAVGGVSQ